MKLNALLFVLSFFCFDLSAQTNIQQAAKEILLAGADDFGDLTPVKSYFAEDAKFLYPNGIEYDLEKFWNWFTWQREIVANKYITIDVKVIDNETFCLFKWEGTMRDENQPKLKGNVAKLSGIYHCVWENGKVKQMNMYWDNLTINKGFGIE
ncbi:MAG: nuclear transport factor 2 family protein [Pseudomonadota bacterium]